MQNQRKYGDKPYTFVVVHGGPGTPGEMAPVARELSKIGGVLEPLQTAGTLEGQIEELNNVLRQSSNTPVILIGHSWGAWLSYLYTARYPTVIKKLILIGAGPFENHHVSQILATRLARLNGEERKELIAVIETLQNPSLEINEVSMERLGQLCVKTDSYDPLSQTNETIEYQHLIHQRVWHDAETLRNNGTLIYVGEKICCPVVAIHGDYDPHPAEGVRQPLTRILKDFRFILLKNCGHTPWIEREAKDRFFDILKKEIK